MTVSLAPTPAPLSLSHEFQSRFPRDHNSTCTVFDIPRLSFAKFSLTGFQAFIKNIQKKQFGGEVLKGKTGSGDWEGKLCLTPIATISAVTRGQATSLCVAGHTETYLS
ncbi:hypothetical protein BT93_L2948 [Corymbia citriodora subsp. variegata]|uniref:Uncharacterized protein n=1 Tax=Corymbia citriodora subsp. variegata TaxID=360336 RepID=A0A8T0CN34_CORYI|nr:hypothetical protein BT93_L2948 [Corymbia citriodora subsp. variegata]